MSVVGGQPKKKKHSNTRYKTNRTQISNLWLLLVLMFVMSDPKTRE